MNRKSVLNCERQGFEKLLKYQIPHSFKRIGYFLFAFAFIGLFVNAFVLEIKELRMFAKVGMLLGLLIVSISKEKVEDELIIKLRMQSYSVAFIWGVFYALCLPVLDYLIDLALGQEENAMEGLGDFIILWMLLSVQVLCFELLKRTA